MEACAWFSPDLAPCTFSLGWFCFVSFHSKKSYPGKFLAVQSLGLRGSMAEGMVSVPGEGTKIPHAAWCSQKQKPKQNHTLSRLDAKFYESSSWIIEASVLAWRIPGMGEPGGLPSLGSHRVGHDWSNLAAAAVGVILDPQRSVIPDIPHQGWH